MKPVVLCILDGVGWGQRDDGDAVYTAQTPTLDRLQNEYPWVLLNAHGTAVGMPSDDDMGNSEVGHNAMGAGRVFAQGAKLVNESFSSASIWESSAWKEIKTRTTLHLLGLLSDGNVHSHIDHLCALIEQAHKENIPNLWVHILTDGRDVDPKSALSYIQIVEEKLAHCPDTYKIATGGGRMHITMDRYNADWNMVQRGYMCHVHGQGERFPDAASAIQQYYEADPKRDDQWIPSFVIDDYSRMKDGDAVLLFNFRGDRAIEISRALEEKNFSEFDRGIHPDIFFAGMMEYDGDLHVPTHYLVAPPQIDDTVGERMANAQKRVLSISETQKFGHVTYFFNGNKSEALPFEEQIELPSHNVPFDQLPEMSAREVTQKVCEAIEEGSFDLIRLNLANGDMVGHCGDFAATVQAMECLDECLAHIYNACMKRSSILLITADHGNADEMYQFDSAKGTYKSKNGQRIPSTSHSKNPVPCILIDPEGQWTLRGDTASIAGGIAQIGATLLDLVQLPIPSHYLPSLVHKL